MMTPMTHNQTDGDTIEHGQTHIFDPHNQQKPTRAQPTKTHITNSRFMTHDPQLEYRPTISQMHESEHNQTQITEKWDRRERKEGMKTMREDE